MNPHTYIGCAVTVILREGSYHGTIHRFDSVDKRITLRDVSNPVNGNKYPGIRHFYASEILDMVLDDDYDESLLDSPPCAVIPTDDTPAYEDATPVTSKAYESPPIKPKESDSPPAKSCDSYTIIEEFNDDFQDVMTLIQDQLLIGFHLVSVGEGRHGKIYWIAISVGSHAYLFDFIALGKNLFKKGLHDILESTKITKIIHDCRLISDLLFHKYSVNLANVFDTQVADAFVHRAWYGVGHKNVWPKFVQPLSVCLLGHLKLSPEEIAGLNAREGKTKVEQDLWPQRPLSVPLAETLVCCVKYLDELRRLLLEKMMVEYMAGVDIYLGTVKSLPDSEVSWYAGKSEFLPKSFNHMNRFTQVIKDSLKNRERESFSEFSPFENNQSGKKHIQQMKVSSKIDFDSKSDPFYEPLSPVADSEITGVPSSLKLTNENKLSPETNPVNDEEDIFIQAAKKLISSDIPSDLLDLLKTPAKNPSAAYEPKPNTLNNSDTTAHDNLSSSSNHHGVEWSRYRKDSLNHNKLSLLPAGCNMALTKKKTKQSGNSTQDDYHWSFPQKNSPKTCQQVNNENQNPIQRPFSGGTPQNRNPDHQITDTFFEIPDSDSFTHDYNVLGQIQTYSVSHQPFQYTANYNKTHRYNNNNNNNSLNSPTQTLTEPKSPVSDSIKATHSTKILSQKLPSHREKSHREKSSSPDVPDEVPVEENGASRNYWVNGSSIVGNGGMTHIERLMAVWRNNCK